MGKALTSVAVFLAAMGGILFLGAGTFDWWQAWLYLALYGVVSLAITAYLVVRDPALLARRMRGGARAESRPAQRLIMALISLLWLASLIVPALDRRFGWSDVPVDVSIIGDALLLAGYFGIWRVFAENSYTAATVQVEREQTLVDTGPYAVVRHPMYAAALPMLAGAALALGSWWTLLVIAAMLPLLAWRLTDEERMLATQLPGYEDYRRRVRWRLVPGVF